MLLNVKRRHTNARQRGVLIVEFALVALLVFFPLLLAIMEFSRWLFTLNAAAEATRWGARAAVVCSMNNMPVQQKMRATLGGIVDALVIDYVPAGCDQQSCVSVKASIVGATFTPLIPYFGVALPIPAFSTTLPRESMDNAGTDNEVCQ